MNSFGALPVDTSIERQFGVGVTGSPSDLGVIEAISNNNN